MTAYPGAKRAAVIAARIEKLADDWTFDPASLALEEKEGHTLIKAGETAVVAIFDEDALLEGLKRQVLA